MALSQRVMSDFQYRNFAVHCKTRKEATEFLEQCRDIGMIWSDGRPLRIGTLWDAYRESTVYFSALANHPGYVMFSSVGTFRKFYSEYEFPIKEYTDLKGE